ncbi:acyl-CoA dehydrogenase family protein [Herminiimonas arsenitoxidans]|uniref:acyl-CoA dehydrogenase family protein n=1 Tax=Herminiimonas arsenitoxidans TaxID=1809410 RepID=UPI0018D43D2F|nr:acyl-CoA dehydrogenase family protein [Herminiimonas arsenitoxidans]
MTYLCQLFGGCRAGYYSNDINVRRSRLIKIKEMIQMWDFSTDAEFQKKLDWIKVFVEAECEPLDRLFPSAGDCYDVGNKKARAIAKPLMEEVKRQGLWACHLGPELGGQGYGQVKLALMNEILGRSLWAPTIFGTAAPDTGNAEIIAMFGH